MAIPLSLLYYRIGRSTRLDAIPDLQFRADRREVSTNFQQTRSSTAVSTDYWYIYDADNHVLTTEGQVSNNAIVPNSGNTQSYTLSYDGAGNRVASQFAGSSNTLYYFYDAANRLTGYEEQSAGTFQTYDEAGRVLSYTSNYTAGYTDTFTYNLNGWLLAETQNATAGYGTSYTVSYDPNWTTSTPPPSTDTGWYDASGNVDQYVYQEPGSSGQTATYTDTYADYDSYKAGTINATDHLNSSGQNTSGTTTQAYDSNGNLITLTDTYSLNLPVRNFIDNLQGQTLERYDTSGKTESYFYQDGNSLGNAGQIGSNNFELVFTPAGLGSTITSPGQYAYQSGNTLESIAQVVYGDSSYAYVIGNANGVTDSDLSNLSPGTLLTIPQLATGSSHDSSQTFKPYNAGSIIGNTNPSFHGLPPPPGKGQNCVVLADIVAAVVTIVVTYLAGPPAGGSTGEAMLAAMAGAAAGSVAHQAVISAANNGEFNLANFLESTAISVAGAAVGAGIGASTFHELDAIKFSTSLGDGAIGGVAGGFAAAVTTTALNELAGLQHNFSWSAVAAGAVGGGLNGVIGSQFPGPGHDISPGQLTAETLLSFAAGTVAQGAQVLIAGHGKIDFANVAADAFGLVIGDGLLGAVQTTPGQVQQQAAQNNAMSDQEVAYYNTFDRQPNPAPATPPMSDADVARYDSFDYGTPYNANPDGSPVTPLNPAANPGGIAAGTGISATPATGAGGGAGLLAERWIAQLEATNAQNANSEGGLLNSNPGFSASAPPSDATGILAGGGAVDPRILAELGFLVPAPVGLSGGLGNLSTSYGGGLAFEGPLGGGGGLFDGLQGFVQPPAPVVELPPAPSEVPLPPDQAMDMYAWVGHVPNPYRVFDALISVFSNSGRGATDAVVADQASGVVGALLMPNASGPGGTIALVAPDVYVQGVNNALQAQQRVDNYLSLGPTDNSPLALNAYSTGRTDTTYALTGLAAVGTVGPVAIELAPGLSTLGKTLGSIEFVGSSDGSSGFTLGQIGAVGDLSGLRAIDVGLQIYEPQIRNMYSEQYGVEFRKQDIEFLDSSGNLITVQPDAYGVVDGQTIAAEAKYTDNWATSNRNPAAVPIDMPYSDQPNMLNQAKNYQNGPFDQVYYHTNSPELMNYYSNLFQQNGITKIQWVLTPLQSR